VRQGGGFLVRGVGRSADARDARVDLGAKLGLVLADIVVPSATSLPPT